MFLVALVCLFVCLSVDNITQKVKDKDLFIGPQEFCCGIF